MLESIGDTSIDECWRKHYKGGNNWVSMHCRDDGHSLMVFGEFVLRWLVERSTWSSEPSNVVRGDQICRFNKFSSNSAHPCYISAPRGAGI